jgi:hypothetical protein
MPGISDEEMRTVSTRQAEYLTVLLLYLIEIKQASIAIFCRNVLSIFRVEE